MRPGIDDNPLAQHLTEVERQELHLLQQVLKQQSGVDFKDLPSGVTGLIARSSPNVARLLAGSRALVEELDEGKRYRPFQTKVEVEDYLTDHPDRAVLKKVASKMSEEEIVEDLTQAMNDKSAGIYRDRELHGVSLRDVTEHAILQEALARNGKPLHDVQPEPPKPESWGRERDVEFAFRDTVAQTGIPGVAIASGTGMLPKEDEPAPGSLRETLREAMGDG